MASFLQTRRRPGQERSRATFERILDTAADLLEEVGWDGFNTNLLAARAGLTAPAVYRYFPNKLAVVSTLAERVIEEWNRWLRDFQDAATEADDPVELWSEYVDLYVRRLRALRGGLAVRRAMAASPPLRELDRKDSDAIARRLAPILLEYNPGIELGRARDAARVLVETSVAITDLAFDASPARGRRLISELKTMQRAYLTELLARPGR